MSKTTIIGLGLVGNSIGMALKQAVVGTQSLHVTGFDPDRTREDMAVRKYASVDEIAPDLEAAVRGAQIVVIATPLAGAREVLAAIDPFLEEGATVTDTLSSKEQVIAWAGELLSPRASFVGGHPFSRIADLEADSGIQAPSAALFRNAPYCIIPSPTARNEALGEVIALVEILGARPLFIDAREHDSFIAAVSHLPSVAAAALLYTTARGATWSDMGMLAGERFKSATGTLSPGPADMRDNLLYNRQALLRWIDLYMLSLREIRDLLASDAPDALLSALEEMYGMRANWVLNNEATVDEHTMDPRNAARDVQLRAELREAIDESRPTRNFMGSYISDRIFRKKDK